MWIHVGRIFVCGQARLVQCALTRGLHLDITTIKPILTLFEKWDFHTETFCFDFDLLTI